MAGPTTKKPSGFIVIKKKKEPTVPGTETEVSNKPASPIKSVKNESEKPAPNAAIPKDLTPFIDKISIVISIPSKIEEKEIYDAFWTAVINDKEAFQSSFKPKNFKEGRWIACPPSVERVRLEYGSKTGKPPHIRLEFNPRKLGSAGMSSLVGALGTILPDGWEYVVNHGRVTRIDVAVDLPGQRMESFLVMPSQGLVVRSFTRNGLLETIYYGSPKGNFVKVYSKKLHRQSQGKLYGKSVVRLEATRKNPAPAALKNLGQLGNPFAKLVLIPNLPNAPDPKKLGEWALFSDGVAIRGLCSALALLPQARRTKYRAHLAAHKLPSWDPAAIWSRWPDALELLMLSWKV